MAATDLSRYIDKVVIIHNTQSSVTKCGTQISLLNQNESASIFLFHMVMDTNLY